MLLLSFALRRPSAPWSNRLALAAVGGLLAASYLATLLPGVGAGDTAELQYMSALLGVCHAPGYAIEVVAGKLFSLLPIGPSIAWRVNLMMAVSGVVGALALQGAVRRVTGQVLPAALAALMLGWSSIYWSFSIAAESYVFHGAFLLLALYASVRFVQSDRERWLLAGSLALGVAIAGRPSEVTVLPAFAALLFFSRAQAGLGAGRLARASLLLLLPFVLSVGFYLLRQDPRHLHARDPHLAATLLSEAPSVEDSQRASSARRAGIERVPEAVLYGLGVRWAGKSLGAPSPLELWAGFQRYATLVTGASLLEGNPPPRSLHEQEHGFGVSLGLTGLFLAAAGAWFHRRRPAWLCLGLGLIAGNAVFYFAYHTFEGLTYTVPGLAGLAFLAGLGAAGPLEAETDPRLRRRLLALAWLTVAVLGVGNYRAVDRSDSTTPLWKPHLPTSEMHRIPRGAAILIDSWHAPTYRYLFHVEAGRTDVQILPTDLDQIGRWNRMASRLVRGGQPTLALAVEGLGLDPAALEPLRQRTPPALARYGFVVVNAGRGERSGARHDAREGTSRRLRAEPAAR